MPSADSDNPATGGLISFLCLLLAGGVFAGLWFMRKSDDPLHPDPRTSKFHNQPIDQPAQTRLDTDSLRPVKPPPPIMPVKPKPTSEPAGAAE